MKGGSQCPACLNIVDFPGKLEKKKKIKYSFLWEEKCSAEGYHNWLSPL